MPLLVGEREKKHQLNISSMPGLRGGFLSVPESKILKFLGFMWNPLSWVMEAAAIMAIALANGGVSQGVACLNVFPARTLVAVKV